MAILLTWLGKTDIDNMLQDKNAAISTIALKNTNPFDRIVILSNSWSEQWPKYESWLKKRLATAERPYHDITIEKVNINSPIDYISITKTVDVWLQKLSAINSVSINLTSGTPAMTAVSILLGKGIANCKFIQSTPNGEVDNIEIPIDFSTVYKRSTSSHIAISVASNPKIENAFSTITAYSNSIKAIIKKAHKLAESDLPVLILGETGTGKEVMANAIHAAGERSNKPFRAINCGAIPESLVDSILFGHIKGAFTGAISNHDGLFAQADGGTLFLDEVGELPVDVQVKLLRVLQEKEITRVGDTKTTLVDVRIIAATHRDLFLMVEEDKFREDLFYRLAVGVLNLPPLRERYDDIQPIVDELLDQINLQITKYPNKKSKKISQSAKNIISGYLWPGNIRELWNTLNRAVLWSDNDIIEVSDIEDALLSSHKKDRNKEISLSYGDNFDLPQHIDNIKKEYIKSALIACGGSKTKAAKMLNVGSHQSLSNWMDKLGLE